MFPTAWRALRLLPFLLVPTLAASPASAAVTFYTDLATFQAATGAVLVADFESQPLGAVPSFTEGGVLFRPHAPLTNIVILGPGPHGATDPDPTSKVLTRSGPEDIDMLPPQSGNNVTCAFGFDTITNRFAPPEVTVHAVNGDVLAVYTLTQAPNTYGFLGIKSDDPIGMVRWRSNGGQNENTALDNIRIADCLSQALPSTWGRVKAHAR